MKKVAILYLPIVHAGHKTFLIKNQPEELYLIGKSLISKFPSLERDVRAMEPEEVAKELVALGLVPKVFVLEEGDLAKISAEEIVLSNDEVGRKLSEKYFKNKKVIFDSTFLRWNSMNSVTKLPAQANQTISDKEFDKKMMTLATKEAEQSSDWWRHVGAVLVKDGKVFASTHNKHAVTENTHYIDGEPRSNFKAGSEIAEIVIFQHGEATLIAKAAEQGFSTKGAEIYITTFPCPTCAMLIANAGIKKVYYREGYSLLDAERILKNSNVELIQIL